MESVKRGRVAADTCAVGAVLHFGGRRRGGDRHPATREIEILRFVAEGYADAEIAERLGVRESLVAEAMAHVIEKLGARTRPHAVTLAFRRGLVH
jgi:DNA-binding CsgD family transcriptional regulator